MTQRTFFKLCNVKLMMTNVALLLMVDRIVTGVLLL